MSDARIQAAIDALNPEQREAVGTTEGALLVLAGAGSGKTRVVTVRTAYLMSQGVPGSEILAVTFTNKAANEMRERIRDLVGVRADAITVGTFHSFCLKVLREFREQAGLGEKFSLCDTSDQMSGMRSVLREQRVSPKQVDPRKVLSAISLAKNRMQTPADMAAPGDVESEAYSRAFEGYQAWLNRSRLIDFDDILVKTADLLGSGALTETGATVQDVLRRRHKYVMVDEYQDTSVVQYEVLYRLAGSKGNICAVGDDDQSIYGWRGADVSKILGFAKDFPGASTVKLETNYRSTPQILEAANKVIRNNPVRHDKTLRAHLPDGQRLEALTAPNDTDEADAICLQIKDRIDRRTANFRDFAILFRTTTQPRAFELQLRARGIPYVLVGGQSFFDRKEVRDVLGYLRAAHNPDDEPALLRVLNRPPRGIGKASIDRTLEFATAQGIPVGEAFDRADEIERVPKAAAESARALRATLAEWAELWADGSRLDAAIQELLERVGYRSEVERNYPDELTQNQRWKAVEDLIDMARRHVEKRRKPTLSKFLQELALSSGETDSRSKKKKKDQPERDVVSLMTLHSAKGLEFPQVYLVGLEEGILPHARAVAEDGVEEERRLCYVGLTRARERLVLSYCLQRSRGGQMIEAHPSRFLFEIKETPPPENWRASGTQAPPPKRKARRKARR